MPAGAARLRGRSSARTLGGGPGDGIVEEPDARELRRRPPSSGDERRARHARPRGGRRRRRAPPARPDAGAPTATAAGRTRRPAPRLPPARLEASDPSGATIRCRRGSRRQAVFITGGAGFIGTTLARELVERNTVVAFDNLHRDALSRDRARRACELLARSRATCSTPPLCATRRAGATHVVHCAAIAGVDTVLESPVRTMRVNVIGTYNVLEAALGDGRARVERFVDFSTSEVFGTHAFRVQEGQVSTIGSVGEARWTYAVSKLAGEHMAHAYHDELGLPTVTVHPFNVFGPGQIGGGAIRAFIETALARQRADDPRRRLADPRVVLRHRHGLRRARVPRASGGGRPGLQHRQPAFRGDDLRPRAAHQATDAVRRRDRLPAAALRRRRVAHPERREGARAARVGAAGRAGRRPGEDDRVVPGNDSPVSV